MQLQDLISQKVVLDKQIEDIRKAEHKEALQTIYGLMRAHGIEKIDLASQTREVKSVAAKYCDPVTGKLWSGRGVTPAVFRAAKEAGTLDSMLIK